MARRFAGFSARPLDEFRGRQTALGSDPSARDMSFTSEPRVGGALAQGGGYERSNYNPNSAFNQYTLAQGLGKGQQTSPQFGSPQNDPRRPADRQAIAKRADVADDADSRRLARTLDAERQEGRIDTVGRANMDRINKANIKASPWRELFQALSEAGADELQTGAAAGWEAPGFYDTQNTMGADAQGRRQLLEALLMNQGRMDDARFVRGIR